MKIFLKQRLGLGLPLHNKPSNFVVSWMQPMQSVILQPSAFVDADEPERPLKHPVTLKQSIIVYVTKE